jgi:NAD(P)-dependent dehydrogenase (short-subunit alcohol dehydrogenase family)
MSWTASDIPDLTGRTAVVTGANGGLGLESAKALAGAGAHVVMAVRDREKAAAAEAEILDAHPGASLELVDLDLGSQASVKAAAATIVDAHPRIDILINNAGLMAIPERRTEDGFEMQFGVNHLGHWTFTASLLPAIVAAPAARVVTVTSTAHHMGRPVDADDVNLEGHYEPWRAYGRSKLANYHFALGLQRVFETAGVAAESLVAHPGLSHTDLQKRTVREGGGGAAGPWGERLAASMGMSAARGALPQLRAATDPSAKGGEMYAPRFFNAGAAVRRPILRPGNDRAIEALWEVSERETGVAIDADEVRDLA